MTYAVIAFLAVLVVVLAWEDIRRSFHYERRPRELPENVVFLSDYRRRREA